MIRKSNEERLYDIYEESETRAGKTKAEVFSPSLLAELENISLLLSQGGGGGGAMYSSVTVYANFTVTMQDFILVMGSNPVTISLPAASGYTKKITIKNASTEDVTILNPSGLVNGISELKIRAMKTATLGERNLGSSIDLLPEGGQFWLV